MDTVIRALDSFYHPKDVETQKQADIFLVRWGNTIGAWKHSLEFLETPSFPEEYRIFAAQTLRKKISQDALQLDEEFCRQLMDRILQVLNSTIHTSSRPLVMQLCLCLASISIHNSAYSFGSLLGTIVSLGVDRKIIVKFLSVFPDQATSTTVSLSTCTHPEALLDANIDQAVGILIPLFVEPDPEVLQCLFGWIKYCGRLTEKILLQDRVLEFGFRSLRDEECCGIASELLGEIVFKSAKHGPDIFVQLVDGLVSTLPFLKQAALDGNEDILRELVYLYADFGEWNMNRLLELDSEGFAAFEGLLLVLEYGDFKIMETTFEAWRVFIETVCRNKMDGPLIRSLVERVVVAMVRSTKYPLDSVEWSRQKVDDFREFRHLVGDFLKECCVFLKPETLLSYLTLEIEQASNSVQGDPNAWRLAEALFTSMRTISSRIDDSEARFLVIWFQLAPFFYKCYSHPSERNSSVRYSILLFVSSYSPWLRHHPEHVPVSFEMCMDSIRNPISDRCFSASSLALWNLCKHSSIHMTDYGESLFHIYKTLEPSASKSVDLVLGAFVYIVDSIEPSKAMELIRIVTDRLISQISTARGKDLAHLLSRYSIVIQSASGVVSRTVFDAFKASMEVFQVAATDSRTERDVQDELSKLFSLLLVCMGDLVKTDDFTPQLVVVMLKNIELGILMYPCTVLVRELSSGSNCEIMAKFVRDIGTVMGREIHMDADFVEDYFHLVSAAMDHVPQAIVGEPEIHELVRFSIRVVATHNPSPRLLELAISTVNELYNLLLDPNQDIRPWSIWNLVPELVHVVLDGVLSTFPTRPFPTIASLLCCLYHVDQGSLITLIQRIIENLPEDRLSHQEKQRLVGQMPENLSDTKKATRMLRFLSKTTHRRI